MARSKRRTHEELRTAVLDAAYAVIAAEGARGFNIRSVAVAAGCSVGSIYNLFKDFDELEMSAILRILAELGGKMFSEPLPSDPRARLDLIGERYLDFAFEKPRLWSMLNESRAVGNPISPDWYRAEIDRLFDLCVGLTKEAFVGGSIDAAMCVKVLWANVHGIAGLSISGRLGLISRATATTLRVLTVETFLAGAKAGAAVADPERPKRAG